MKRILVVEDEASIRELVALNLKMTGWEVLEAPSAERALELIQKNPPCDVALLDIMLPGMACLFSPAVPGTVFQFDNSVVLEKKIRFGRH